MNPGHAGATLVFDARYISGLADADPVSTWSDRSGQANNATQVLTARPAFKTAIQGGNPVVRFDGSNDTLLLTSGITSIATRTILIVSKKTSGQKMVGLCGATTVNGPHSCYDFTNANLYVGDGAGYWNTTGGGNLTSFSITSDAVNASASPLLFVNGVAKTLGSKTTATSGTTLGCVGARPAAADFSAGDIGAITLLPAYLSNPLRRRLEQNMSRAWKIPCS